MFNGMLIVVVDIINVMVVMWMVVMIHVVVQVMFVHPIAIPVVKMLLLGENVMLGVLVAMAKIIPHNIVKLVNLATIDIIINIDVVNTAHLLPLAIMGSPKQASISQPPTVNPGMLTNAKCVILTAVYAKVEQPSLTATLVGALTCSSDSIALVSAMQTPTEQ